jgi:hypothetical protein
MKNRHLPLAVLLLASILPTQALSQAAAPGAAPQTVESVRQAARENKRELVEKNMELTADEAKRFWPIYDAYQKELDGIVKRQNRAVLDYVNTEGSMSDANAKRLVSDLQKADSDELKLRHRTVDKMMGVLPGRKAARFMQVENKIATLNRFDVAEKVRLVR